MSDTDRLLISIRNGVAFIAGFLTFSFVSSVIAVVAYFSLDDGQFLLSSLIALVGGVVSGAIVYNSIASTPPAPDDGQGFETY